MNKNNWYYRENVLHMQKVLRIDHFKLSIDKFTKY